MKAAVLYDYGAPLRVEDLTIDGPARGEVRVRMAACAICHSDVHAMRGEWARDPLPCVFGHEAAGVVEQVGEGVTSVKPGDHVAVSLIRSCGRCHDCTIGNPWQCSGANDFALAKESRLRNAAGQPVRHGLATAAFAEMAVVHESQVVRVPDDLPLDVACLLACGVITGVGAVLNTAQLRPGSSAVVIGTGGVGLNAVQGARIAGATPIIAIDLIDAKLEAAKRFGATHAINAGREDAATAVRELTGGRRADYVFVTVGSARAVEQALTLVGKRGTVVLVGIPPLTETITLPVSALRDGERRIVGCNMGSTRLSVDVPRLVALYREGRLKLDELITARYPLERIDEAIASTEAGGALRNVIVF